jgi:hypothetical protein
MGGEFHAFHHRLEFSPYRSDGAFSSKYVFERHCLSEEAGKAHCEDWYVLVTVPWKKIALI